jgi:transposase
MPVSNTATTPEPEWAAFAAIDWADQKHDWKLCDAATGQCTQGQIKSTPEEIDDWCASLRQRFNGRPVAVCLEQARGPLIYQLIKHSHLVLYPINPATSASFRQALYPSGAKSDPVDTALLLELLMSHRKHLRPLHPDSPETRRLQILAEQRRNLVDDRTAYSNRLTIWLKQYYPQVLDWIDNIDSPLGCDLLERWPSLQLIQCAKPNVLAKFFTDHNCRSQARIDQRIQAIYAAHPGVEDSAIVEAGKDTVLAIVAILQTLNAHIARFDGLLAELLSTHPLAPIFANVPGAGPVLLPRLIVAFGTKPDRYLSASELQAYSGIAPIQQSSGKTESTHFRFCCPKFLRQTFHELAAHSITSSEWARQFYDSQRALKKTHHAAVRALAFKWIRILFACWRDNTPYDEATYVAALNRRKSPLTTIQTILGSNTAVGWASQAGFQKFSKDLA